MTIKLKNLIPESISPRREESYEDAIRTLIATKYSEAFSQAKLGRKLYRGFRRRTGFNLLSKYYTLDPKTRPRYAKSTNNLYVAFMDTFPQWEKYPKRGLSVICSPELEEAASYGEPYVVLFENETIVSQSNNSDFWDGMPYIEKRTQCSVNKLMDAVEDLMRIFNIHKKTRFKHESSKEYTPENVNEFFEQMKFVDKDSLNKFSSTDFEVSRDIYHFGYEEFQRLAHDMVNSKYGPEDGWKTYFEDLFDPVKNEVELHSISDISGSGECWSDRRCLLIQVNEWNDKFQR